MSEPLRPDVAIVGGGPAGLGAAVALKRRGVAHVMVLDREHEAGGIPRQCGHPPYGVREFGRLMTGPTYARRLRELAVREGVDIHLRHSVAALHPGGRLSVATPEGMIEVVAGRVILATGGRETPRSARFLSGDRPLGILNTGALQDYIYLKGLRPFERPVVVGTELVSLSALWTCLRHGIRPAAVIEAGDRATARWPLGLFPRLLGIPVYYGTQVEEIIGLPKVERVSVVDRQGHGRSIACDGVLLTGRFVPEASLMRMAGIALDRGSGGPAIDQYGRCSDPAYFAAGNLLRAIETAGWCHYEGRRIGMAVADDLAGLLPPPTESIALVRGAGVQWIVPQSIALPATGATGGIQLRAAGPVRGRLTLRQGDRVLWSRRLASRQERRLHIPIGAIRERDGLAEITVAIESGG